MSTNPGSSHHSMDITDLNNVASASELQEGEDDVVQEAYRDLLGKTSDYLKSEFESTAEDYRLIQQLNSVTKDKYEGILGMGKQVKSSLGTMNERFGCIKPFMDRIDFVEAQVNELERTVFRLDTYAKQLELRFKSLDKRQGH